MMKIFDTKLKTASCVVFASVLLMWHPVFAHHAEQGYTRGGEARITVSGIIKEYRWANPHTQIYLDHTLPNGEIRTWVFELNSPGNLIRNGGGWSHNAVKVGDLVTATFNPALEDRSTGTCLALELPDGQVLRSRQGCAGFDNN